MIEELNIKNFAVIEDLAIRFGPGLNVITGETGAGKTMLIEALRFLFGFSGPAAACLRTGSKKMEVSAQINIHDASSCLLDELKALEITPDDGFVIIRRTFENEPARSKCFIQDVPVALGTAKKIGRLTIEMHGQGDAQDVYGAGFAQTYLDRWAGLGENLSAYRKIFQDLKDARQKLDDHRRFVTEHLGDIEYLRHNLNELEEIALNPETLDLIENQLPLWISSEQVTQSLSELCDAAGRGETNAAAQVSRAIGLAAKLKDRLGPRHDLEAIGQDLEKCRQALEEVLRQASAIENSLNFDPVRLEELLGLRAKIQKLLAKHKCQSPGELAQIEERLGLKLKTLEDSEVQEAALQKIVSELEDKARRQAAKISKERKKAAGQLEKILTKEIRLLGMDKAGLSLEAAPAQELGWSGSDKIIFWFEPNPGEGRRELRQIASGGESSRAALALKSLLMGRGSSAELNPAPRILVLDEIEQGLSAKAASLIARRLADLSQSHQIFAVTHSPLIASRAGCLFYMEKAMHQGRPA
ncbi:MAG: AAA family ATPase [Elusimicrobia bacterium]|nr:AAA family ATPase [Elusimicrobiota bacterium]